MLNNEIIVTIHFAAQFIIKTYKMKISTVSKIY